MRVISLVLAGLTSLSACDYQRVAVPSQPTPELAYSAGIYTAINWYRVAVSDRDDATIEVFARRGSSGRDYFCAAAEFAVRRLGASSANVLILVTPEAPSARAGGSNSVHMLLVSRDKAGELSPNGIQVSMTRVGENHTVGGSRAFCPNPWRRFYGTGVGIGLGGW
jgi:hypothetical protein